MPTEIDFTGALDSAWGVIETQLAPFLDTAQAEKLALKLAQMKAHYVAFWAKKLAGDPRADEDMEIIRARAELIAARFAFQAGKIQRSVVKQVLEIAAQLGAQILLAVLKR